MSLCLLLCSGCSARPVVVTEPEVIRPRPLALLMEPTPEPGCRSAAQTNGDLLRCLGDFLDALREANADKAALKLIIGEAKP